MVHGYTNSRPPILIMVVLSLLNQWQPNHIMLTAADSPPSALEALCCDTTDGVCQMYDNCTAAVDDDNDTTATTTMMMSNMTCNGSKVWPTTGIGMTAIVKEGCYNRTVPAIRRCNCSMDWEEKSCCVSNEFSEFLEEIEKSPLQGIRNLSNIEFRKNVSLKQRAFLLRKAAIGMRHQPHSKEFIEEFFDTSRKLMTLTQDDVDLDIANRTSIGTQLLLTLDEFTLDLVEPNITSTANLEFENSVVKVLGFDQAQRDAGADHIIGILANKTCITVPKEVIGDNITGQARVVSFIHYNVSTLLPPKNTMKSIVSPIVSSTTTCQSCISNITFKSNVTLMFNIQQNASQLMTNGTLSCIFFEIEHLVDEEFPTGEWDGRGCTVTGVQGNQVNCSCNHLTHFAILLSPGTDGISETDRKVLTILGVVLVPISLFCLSLIVFIYTFIRSLWSMRNYIHIMLCVSLFMAQFVFMVGIDKVDNKDTCASIAAVLQYLFLVTFMWMLMEGVVLYVTLVTVFIKHHHRYIIAFTIASYGLPAIYMAIVVPIGFLVGVDDIPGHTHYLYYDNDQLIACWLNYETYFIWSFIGPVILILLVNIGFFIMAIVIIKKHSKRNKTKKASDPFTIKHWLKVSVSLTVIMGITWLAGVLVFREELIFLAYIMTIFIAGQGVVFFIILVPLSKQVREALLVLWYRVTCKQPARGDERGLPSILTKLSKVTSSSSNNSSTSKLTENTNVSTGCNSHHLLSSSAASSGVSSSSSLVSPTPPPFPSIIDTDNGDYIAHGEISC